MADRLFRPIMAGRTTGGLRNAPRAARSGMSGVLGLLACLAPLHMASAGARMAVIPTQTIYPGEIIDAGRLEEVEVTNPDLSGDYASSIGEISGKVSKRTLLPGRVVFVSSVREPYAVERGASVRLVFAMGQLSISAMGSPLQDAAIGDLIRVRNIDTGVIVQGTVMADGSIQVVAK